MRFGAYGHLEDDDPLFGGIEPCEICKVAVKHNYGALRMATALVVAIENEQANERTADGRPIVSSLGVAIRDAIERGCF